LGINRGVTPAYAQISDFLPWDYVSMKHYPYLVCVLLAGVVVLNSCSMPSKSTESVPTREAAYTAAAETVIAQLTQAVQTTVPGMISSGTPIGPTQINPSQSTDTPSPSVTVTILPTPTATLTPTESISSDDPKLRLGDPDWRDTFKNGDNWSLYEDEHVRFQVRDRLLVMTAFQADGRDSWMLTWPEPVNYYLEITAAPQACSGLDRYGVIFRTDAEVGYLFGFSCDGQYSLRRWNGEDFKMLVDWTSSQDIRAGGDQTNRMGLMVQDDQFTLYANGNRLAETSDVSYSEGGLGLFVAAKDTEDFKIQVSEVAYWELP
jgi:hypothetical protein